MIIPTPTPHTTKLTHRQYNLVLVEQQLVALRDSATDEALKLLIQQILIQNEILAVADSRSTLHDEKYLANYVYPNPM